MILMSFDKLIFSLTRANIIVKVLVKIMYGLVELITD
jgi:hypothetical protein